MSFMRSVFRKRSSGPYKYQQLTGSSDFRLLTLSPGDWDSPIKCKLHYASLDKPPQYEALSYVWGHTDPANPKTILLDHHVFTVTPNLEVALRAVRDTKNKRILWVDAICIDQENIPERNSQVRLMGRIYESSHTVVSWLGDAAEDSDKAMAFLTEVGLMVHNVQEDDESTAMRLPERLDVETITALWRLLQRPYWSRVWIIQEQHFAGDFRDEDQDRCRIGCGRQWISRFLLTRAFLFLQVWGGGMGGMTMNFDPPSIDTEYDQNRLRTFDESPGLQMFEQIKLARYISENASAGQELSMMMHKTRHFKATDPKDMVFALIGLLQNKKDFSIDYARSVEHVLKDAVEFSIAQDKTLFILKGNRKEVDPNGSSWLPNSKSYLRSTTPWDRWQLYEASKDLPAEKPRFDHTERKLLVRGVIIGKVSTSIGPFGQAQVMLLKNADLSGLPYGALIDYYRDLAPDRRETFWRTLVLNQETIIDSFRHPAPEALAHMCDVLIGDGTIPEDFEPEMREQGNDFGHRQLYTYRFVNNLSVCAGQRCFVETENGYMGMGPYRTKPGDVVVALIGGSLPFVLRPSGSEYLLVGDGYVHGAMDGEFLKVDDGENMLNAQEFILC